MNLYHLKTFYYTAKYRSYTKAAAFLSITQPAVTRQIQELQSNYDLVLFNRIGKKIILTDAGESLYALAEKIFELEMQVEESIRDFQHQKSGKISIVTAETFGAFYLPRMIINFHRSHPDIYVSVLTLTDRYVIEKVSNLTYDIGFISKEMEHPKIIVKELFEESVILIASPGHPLAKKSIIEPAELDNVQMVMPEPDSGTRNMINEFSKRHNVRFNVVCEFSNNDSIKTLVQEGMGLSLISKNVVQGEIRRGDLAAIKINDCSLTRKYYITYHREKYFTRTISDFMEITKAWAGDYTRENFP